MKLHVCLEHGGSLCVTRRIFHLSIPGPLSVQSQLQCWGQGCSSSLPCPWQQSWHWQEQSSSVGAPIPSLNITAASPNLQLLHCLYKGQVLHVPCSLTDFSSTQLSGLPQILLNLQHPQPLLGWRPKFKSQVWWWKKNKSLLVCFKSALTLEGGLESSCSLSHCYWWFYRFLSSPHHIFCKLNSYSLPALWRKAFPAA